MSYTHLSITERSELALLHRLGCVKINVKIPNIIG